MKDSILKTDLEARIEKTAAIQTEGLSKDYPGFLPWKRRPALHPLDLRIAEGEFFGLLGPNGSGKSTTLRLLAGIERPSSGKAAIYGFDVGTIEAKKLFGYVPQESPFPPFRKGREVLVYLGKLRGMSRSEAHRRADALLEKLEIQKAAQQKVRHFSYGTARRLTLAQAIIHRPRILLLDEPAAGLDPRGMILMEEILLELHKEGTTILMSTHQAPEADIFFDRMAILMEGKLLASGSPVQLLADSNRLQLEIEGMSLEEGKNWAQQMSNGNSRRIEVRHPSKSFHRFFREILKP